MQCSPVLALAWASALPPARPWDAIARQPEAADKIQSSLLIGCALAEATAVYGLVIGIMLIFVLLNRERTKNTGKERVGVSLLNLNWDLVWTIINLLVLFLLLKRFLFKPITEMMESRTAEIENNLKDAEDQKQKGP